MDTIRLRGRILFDPVNKTKKHEAQSSWKIIAMIMFGGDVSEYYAWFIKKRFGLALNKPLRGAHISFINDKISNIQASSDEERIKLWENLKKKYDGKQVEVVLNVDVRTNGKHWWFNVPEEDREEIHNIRNEIGLGRPNFGLHMSLGYATERALEHSQYIHDMLRNGLIKK